MKVKAVAEEGLVISNATNGTYDKTAETTKANTVAGLKPGSTSDLENWFHSVSTDPSDENIQQEYEAATEDVNYVIHDFYIKSSAGVNLTVSSLDVKEVEAKVSGAAASQELSKALRVGILIDGDESGSPAVQNVYIYAPVDGFTDTYTVTNQTGDYDDSTGKRTEVQPFEYDDESNSAITTSPARSTNSPIHVQIFIWFEGEDVNCISNNLAATLEEITVNVTFGYTAA